MNVTAEKTETIDSLSAIHESLPAIATTLQDGLDAVGQIIRHFEENQERQGYELLAQLLHAIQVLYRVLSQDAGWADPADAEISREDIPERLEGALEQLIAANERRDWIAIADILEYEISPILASYKRIVEETSR
jgi:hypothetical protein